VVNRSHKPGNGQQPRPYQGLRDSGVGVASGHAIQDEKVNSRDERKEQREKERGDEREAGAPNATVRSQRKASNVERYQNLTQWYSYIEADDSARGKSNDDDDRRGSSGRYESANAIKASSNSDGRGYTELKRVRFDLA